MARPRKNDPFNKRKKGKVTVKSRTYGEHTRAARGTHKEAVLNEAMQAASRRMTGSNMPAKLIRDALNPFLTNFKAGQFWQRLVEHFAGQAKKKEDYSVIGLENRDINLNYPLTDILDFRSMEVNIDMPSLSMELTCNYGPKARFMKRTPYVDGLQLTVIVLFPDFKENDITVESTVLPIKKLNDNAPYSFILNIPVIATEYLICWKIEGCEKGMTKNTNVTKAVYLEEAGKL